MTRRFNKSCVICVLSSYNNQIVISTGHTKRYYEKLRKEFLETLRPYVYNKGMYPRALHLCGLKHQASWLAVRNIMKNEDTITKKERLRKVDNAQELLRDAQMKLALIHMKMRNEEPVDEELVERTIWEVEHYKRLEAQRRRRANEIQGVIKLR